VIIDITISNFRSIKRKQTFSLFAESPSKHLENNIARSVNGKIGVFRTAAIYGANASGKSNLLKAFDAIRYIVGSSGGLKDGDQIPCYEPYLLASKEKKSPTMIEIEFISTDSIRYIYKVKFNDYKILTESLDFYPSRAKANLFKRELNSTWENVKFGVHYKGGKKKFAFFPNNSYLSKAGNSADSPQSVRSIFNYFRRGIFYLGAEETVVTHWKEDQELVKKIGLILSKVDTGISGLSFRDQDINDIEIPNFIPKEIRQKILDDKQKIPIFHHIADNGFEEFTDDMESAGTMKLFTMLPMLISTFNYGGTLLLDELDNSFHPHIAELIIKLFNNPNVNKKNAQLIFSTHNINLMSPELLRRDQVWLTEKDKGETTIISLEDFDKNSVKIDSPFNRWYDDGRFGAIPKIDFKSIAEIISKG